MQICLWLAGLLLVLGGRLTVEFWKTGLLLVLGGRLAGFLCFGSQALTCFDLQAGFCRFWFLVLETGLCFCFFCLQVGKLEGYAG